MAGLDFTMMYVCLIRICHQENVPLYRGCCPLAYNMTAFFWRRELHLSKASHLSLLYLYQIMAKPHTFTYFILGSCWFLVLCCLLYGTADRDQIRYFLLPQQNRCIHAWALAYLKGSKLYFGTCMVKTLNTCALCEIRLWSNIVNKTISVWSIARH